MKTNIQNIYRLIIIGGLMAFLLGGVAYAFGKKKTDANQTQDASVWILKPDGAKKCGAEEIESLEKGAERLKAMKIQVLEARKKSDGKMRIEMCGAPAGTMNTYRINRVDVPIAVGLGFVEAPKGFVP